MDMQKPLSILGPVDTAFYYVDSRETPMNIGALTIFEGKIDFDRFVKLIDSRIHEIPLYMQKVIQAPLSLGQPTWVFDPDFAIEKHVFNFHLDAPGTEEDLRLLASDLISAMLDRSKPLWEVYHIDGLMGNRTALLMKIHHCMVDGISAVELFTLLMDLTPEVKPAGKKPAYDPPSLPSAPELVVEAFRQDIPTKRGLLEKLGHEVSYFGSVFADKEKRRHALVGIANLINDNLRPIKKLVVNGTNTGKMQIAWNEFSLDEVKAIRATIKNASVNDVMLTILGGAVHAYARRHGMTPGQNFVRMLVPVNMREKDETGKFGNRISVLPMDVPFQIDPLVRLQAVTDYTQVMKLSSLSHGLDMILTLPSLAPSPTQPLIWQIAPAAFALLAHTWATNVAAAPIPLYMMGHKLLHAYGYFPLNPGNGMASVIMSYDGRITLTLVTDQGIIPDALELSRYVHEAYVALRKAAKVPEIKPVVAEIAPVEIAAPTEAKTVVSVTVNETSEKSEAVIITETVYAFGTAEAPVNGTSAHVAGQTLVIEETVITADCDPVTDTLTPVTPAAHAAEPVVQLDVETSSAEAVTPEASASAEPEVEEAPAAPEEKPKLFSEGWALKLMEAINNNPAYYKASTRWEAGKLAFVMEANARFGFVKPAAVLLDLHKGICREAHAVPLETALEQASFVIETDYNHWMNILAGKSQPLMMLMTGQLKLKKGSMAKLMPFTQSAQELVHSAQRV